MKRTFVLLALVWAAFVPTLAQSPVESALLEELADVQTQAQQSSEIRSTFVVESDLVIANRLPSQPMLERKHRLADNLTLTTSTASKEPTQDTVLLDARESLIPKHIFFLLPPATLSASGEVSATQANAAKSNHSGFRWKPALTQSLMFLGVQHGYAMTQPKTRRALRGPFFKDYVRSVKSLHGWADGGRFFTNYIAHPMQGSLKGFIQVHNDPKGIKQRFSGSKSYWISCLKALAWSTAWSTQFEIGPVSQASIGNVGLQGKQTYVDLVMTSTAGTGLLVAEDAMDAYVVRRIERKVNNFYVKITSRMLLNPTRTCANLLRFKKPWHRDAGLR